MGESANIGPIIPPLAEPAPTGWAVPRALLMLAGPIIGTMISRTLMSFVDFAMVSQLGTEAMAAIMPAGIILFVMVSFGMGLLSTINAFVSQSLGRERWSDCSAYAWQGLWLSLAFGLAVMPLWFIVPDLFAWIGHQPGVQAMEVAYTQAGLWHIGPALAAMAVSNFFNGIHRPAVGFWAMIIANLLNVLANYALIFGHFGLPAMGIAGAAWGTVLSAIVQAVIPLIWMLRPTIARRYGSWATWRPHAPMIHRILRFGLPAAAQHTIEIVVFALFTMVLVGRTVEPDGTVVFDQVQQAANNLTFRFLEVSFMPAVGLGIAVSAAVGKAIGQRRPDRARVTVWWAAGFAVAYMGLVGVSYLLLGRHMADWLTDDPAVIDWAVKLLLICAVFQVFDAVGITHGFALRGAGDNVFPAVMMTACGLIVFLGGGYAMTIVKPEWGSVGPWLAATAYIIVLGVALFLRWRFGPWEHIEMIDDGP